MILTFSLFSFSELCSSHRLRYSNSERGIWDTQCTKPIFDFSNMKLEAHDDGYETSADMLMNPANVNHNHEVKREKMEDPYSFIDDDPIPMLPSVQGPPHMMHPMPPLNNQMIPGPKKRGRKKKIKPEYVNFVHICLEKCVHT